MNLPPLPEPDMGHQKDPDDCEWETSYSAEAMRAYAAEAVRVALDVDRCPCGYPAPCANRVPITFCRALGETK